MSLRLTRQKVSTQFCVTCGLTLRTYGLGVKFNRIILLDFKAVQLKHIMIMKT